MELFKIKTKPANYATVAAMQAAADAADIAVGDVGYVVAQDAVYFVDDNGTVYPLTDATVTVADFGSLPAANEGDLAINSTGPLLYQYTAGAWVQISSPVDYSTLTALYDDADAGNLNAGSIYRIAWSGDAHVADGQIVTQWTGAEFVPDPMTQVEFPSWLIESADWQLVNGQATGSLSFDADGRPILTVDITTTGYAGVTTATRYENAYSSFVSRAELTNVNGLGAGAFNRLAPVAFVGNAIDLSGGSFNPIFSMAGTFETNGYFSNCRLGGGGYNETLASLGRSWTASERGKFLYTLNNDSIDTSAAFTFGLEAGDKVDQIDSNNDGPELLEAPLALRPAMMSLCPNTGSGSTAQAKLLGIKLSSIAHQTTDPRTY